MPKPQSAYRLQFTPSFDFDKASEIIDYISKLGISHIYASPILTSRCGSAHGYDVVKHHEINPELGGIDGLNLLIGMIKSKKMGWIQDIVPNHMAYDGANRILNDILENGKSSKYFDFFDVDWEHPYESIRGKILAPFLDKFYAVCLENGELFLQYNENGLSVKYYDLSFPLKIDTYPMVLTHKFHRLKLEKDNPDYTKFLGVLYILKTLPTAVEDSTERLDQIGFIKHIIWELYTKNEAIKKFIDNTIRIFNGNPEDPASFTLLDELLSSQMFRLSYWKVASQEINYKRFFNVNGLISLKMDNKITMDYTHKLIYRFVSEGKIDGLRIDHIDGIYDPHLYIKRLREKTGRIYIVVEKILETDEVLPSNWNVNGTTGYDFLNYTNGVFCRTDNEKQFAKIYSRFTGITETPDTLGVYNKRLIIERHITGEIDNLTRILKKLSGNYRYGSDLTFTGLKSAIRELMVNFPVYRTYINTESTTVSDRKYIQTAIDRAKEQKPELIFELEFIQKILYQKTEKFLSEEDSNQWLNFVMKFQQYSGPLMAKGIEDTLFYIYNRLLSLNEVGSSLDHFGIELGKFHSFFLRRAKKFPSSMNTLSTHDTKRGEDIRARLNVLSEIPREWDKAVRTWSNLNRKKKKKVEGVPVPSKNEEYFIYQTLIGALPYDIAELSPFTERVKSYIIKASREAKVSTGWIKPDEKYEEALLSFVEKLLVLSPQNSFYRELTDFQKRIAFYGIFNSLSQTLIKTTSPGVPDFYQGTELWDLNFVDPDNRRNVDYDTRKAYLDYIIGKEDFADDLIAELLDNMQDGRIKLFLIYRTMKFRRENPRIFERGEYIPLEVFGKYSNNIIAFARKYLDEWAITVAPRFLTFVVKHGDLPLGEVWEDTKIKLPDNSPSVWKNMLNGKIIKGNRIITVSEALQVFPCAVLYGKIN